VALAAVVAAFIFFSLAVAILTPAWEAPDEDSHVLNVETLVRGHWYRMEPGAGLEPHQPPLYYLGLAGWQRLFRTRARHPQPVGVPIESFSCEYDVCAAYRHDLPQEAADKRLVLLLRIPSVLCGVGVVLLTAAVARRMSRDPWSPVVAAAMVAAVPEFVFLSGSVNNDNLANLLAAVLLFVCVLFVDHAPRTTRDGWRWALLLGGLVGLLLLTKLSAAMLLFGVVISIWLATKCAWSRFNLLALAAISGMVVCSFWVVQNLRWYGDPLAVTRSREYLRPLLGLGFPRSYGAVRILLVDLPDQLYRGFWYNSAIGHLPLWLALFVAIGGLAIPSARATPRNTAHLGVLAAFVVAALLALGAVILQTATARATVAHVGLPALCCLAALGAERLPIPVAARFVGPVLGLIATALGVRGIIDVFHP
jgi:Dolichyl-phosphate-mannose-protein mannosyltransferase